jgi:hypothetical protein
MGPAALALFLAAGVTPAYQLITLDYIPVPAARR